MHSKNCNHLNSLILCAGLGSRLEPLTQRVPKPLLPVGNSRLVDFTVEQLVKINVKEIRVNAHHLKEELENWADAHPHILECQSENQLLGTGGPLHRAWRAAPEAELLVLNGDVYQNFDLKNFVEKARASSADFALLGVDRPEVNTLGLCGERLCGIKNRWGKEGSRSLTFSGISWYSPKALQRLADFGGENCFDIRNFWLHSVERDVAPLVVEEMRPDLVWVDWGTPAGMLRGFGVLDDAGLLLDRGVVKDARGNFLNSTSISAPENLQNSLILEESTWEPANNSAGQWVVGKDFAWKL